MCEPVTSEDLEKRHVGKVTEPPNGGERRKMPNGRNGFTARWAFDVYMRIILGIAVPLGLVLLAMLRSDIALVREDAAVIREQVTDVRLTLVRDSAKDAEQDRRMEDIEGDLVRHRDRTEP